MTKVFRNISELRTVAEAGTITDAALVSDDAGTIAWVGPAAELPGEYADAETVDLGGRAVLPGWVDSHTHMVFDGNRAEEFEARMAGGDPDQDSTPAAAGAATAGSAATATATAGPTEPATEPASGAAGTGNADSAARQHRDTYADFHPEHGGYAAHVEAARRAGVYTESGPATPAREGDAKDAETGARVQQGDNLSGKGSWWTKVKKAFTGNE